MSNKNTRFSQKQILFAALAGGLAEVIWIICYSFLTTSSATIIAHNISTTFIPGLLLSGFSVTLGIMIHFILSVMLVSIIANTVFRVVTPKWLASIRLLILSVFSLMLVWMFNFFILLPIINPEFVALLPYTVTLTSKLLFGIGIWMSIYIKEAGLDLRQLNILSR